MGTPTQYLCDYWSGWVRLPRCVKSKVYDLVSCAMNGIVASRVSTTDGGFNHVHTFKGHEHKVTAVLFVDSEPPVCISAYNGGDIFIWLTKLPFEEKPIRRLNKEKYWLYSGIYAFADYSFSSTMSAHKLVVSTLAVCIEVLYSESWDGTIRLWYLSDHSPLAVFGEETPTCSFVLSLDAQTHIIVSGHKNGCIKIWNNDVPLSPILAHPSSIFSIYMEGQWLFSNGCNKTIAVQKVLGDESRVDVTETGSISGDLVVTTLLYWQGRLFVGQADKIIKEHSAEKILTEDGLANLL
ncbi:zinc ion binding protein [Tanacetum coccineum]